MTRFTKTLIESDGDECSFIGYDQPNQSAIDGVYVQVSAAGEAVVAAGPFTPETLRAALDAVDPAGFDARTEQPRPLTADDITDEARGRAYRAVAALSVSDWDDISGVAKGRAMALVEAVITEITRPEPPARPEGAEELARLIADADVGEWDCGDLADALLATGRVRVVTEEQS